MRILGIDPGLQTTGFGVIDADGPRLAYVASGTIKTSAVATGDLPARLKIIFDGVREVAARYVPQCASVEIVFVNVNPQSTLLLGQARGAERVGDRRVEQRLTDAAQRVGQPRPGNDAEHSWPAGAAGTALAPPLAPAAVPPGREPVASAEPALGAGSPGRSGFGIDTSQVTHRAVTEIQIVGIKTPPVS